MDAIDRLNDVYKELPRTRAELGNAPLVTPTSQIIGVQAVMNVLVGRYKMVSNQVKDYVYGLYGKTPTPIDPEVAKTVLKGYTRGNQPISCRPGDVLECELEEVKEAVKDVAKTEEDRILCAIYPMTGKQFVASKYGKGEPPKETEKVKTLEDVKAEDARIAEAKKKK
jgi:pyruvate carboxylase subunit B